MFTHIHKSTYLYATPETEPRGILLIKISLYRVADESDLTTLLLKALENGKKVTVFVEAKARFDEENNIEWGRKFEEKGAEVKLFTVFRR